MSTFFFLLLYTPLSGDFVSNGSVQPKGQARGTNALVAKGPKPDTPDDEMPWPAERSKDMQFRLMKQSFSDFVYLDQVHNDEGKRMQQYKPGKVEYFPDIGTLVERSKANRKTAVRCAIYLDKHAELFHKLDPGFRHTKSQL